MRIWFNKTFSTIAAVLRSLRESVPAGEIALVCSQTYSTATAFLAADECYLEPDDLTGQAYLDWCLHFCQQHKIDWFWPGKEAALMSANHAAFDAIGVRVLSVADFATLMLLHNKAEFYRQLPSNIANVMDFIAVNTLDEFDKAVAILSTKHEKLCIKPAVSVYGLGFRVLDTQHSSITHIVKGAEYQASLAELRQGMCHTAQFDTLLVMEHLAGSEWSVDCAARHGELLCAIQRKKSLLPGHGQRIDNEVEINAMVLRLTQYYKLNGIFNIQFKQGIHGIRLLEINARPSGGFGMACLAGVNLAKLVLSSLTGDVIKKPSIQYGLKVGEVKLPVILPA